jgi:hypothetical protein
MRISSLGIILISMAAISGCVAADGASDESKTEQASTIRPDNSAFVINVGTDENPVKVSSPGTTTNTCGDSCTYAYIAGSTLTITTRAQNTIDCVAFSGWSGACAGQGTTCTVTLNSDLSTFASFDTTIRGCIPK